MTQFQTLHDFNHYMERGLLDAYKPANWDKVYPDHKDPHDRWTGLYGVTFSNYVNLDMVDPDNPPRDALDLPTMNMTDLRHYSLN